MMDELSSLHIGQVAVVSLFRNGNDQLPMYSLISVEIYFTLLMKIYVGASVKL